MTDLKELIEQEIDQYLEWPTADKSHVTTVSAKLFAEHMARLYADHIADASKKVGRPQIREAFLRNGAVIPADRDDLPDYVYESVFELLEMAAPAVQGEKPRRYPIGPLTYEKVFEAAGLTNLSDMQAVLDAVEAALSAPAAPAVQGDPVAMSNDKMRAEFDSWIEKQGMVTMKDGETYYHRATHAAWQAWKASRDALVVEQQPAPDVSGLVEALEEGLRAIGDHHAPGDCYATGPMTGDPFRDLVQCPACSFIAMCDDLLAARRKGGEA